VMSPRNPTSILVTTEPSSEWGNDFISWNVGLLTSVWMFAGLEGVVHMGEETKNARETAPRAMIWGIATNGILGIVIIITLLICMPPLQDVLTSPYPFFYLIETSTGSKSVTTVLAIGICIINTGCCLSMYASSTRLTWAWARDGGLPCWFGHVHGTRRVPVRAVLLTFGLAALLILLNLNSTTFVALGAITSLSSFALYFSYAIILSVTIHVRMTTGLRHDSWNIGRFSTPVNIYALVWTLYAMIWLPFPTEVPVTAMTMNYSGPVFGMAMAIVTGGWFAWAKANWAGPNPAVVACVLA
ncbi:amino acid/polyamine transporter I, partial [Microdochium bolleyi]